MYNCNCHKPWSNFKLKVKCEWCLNDLWSKASGFVATFCHYKDWNDQIVKTFTTGSSNAGEPIGKVMCPINTYVSGFQGKYGSEQG
jgi:hypothetical protein